MCYGPGCRHLLVGETILGMILSSESMSSEECNSGFYRTGSVSIIRESTHVDLTGKPSSSRYSQDLLGREVLMKDLGKRCRLNGSF
jgi:hypothetical protein